MSESTAISRDLHHLPGHDLRDVLFAKGNLRSHHKCPSPTYLSVGKARGLRGSFAMTLMDEASHDRDTDLMTASYFSIYEFKY